MDRELVFTASNNDEYGFLYKISIMEVTDYERHFGRDRKKKLHSRLHGGEADGRRTGETAQGGTLGPHCGEQAGDPHLCSGW